MNHKDKGEAAQLTRPPQHGQISDVDVVRRAVQQLWEFASQMAVKHGMDGDDTLTDAQHHAFQAAGSSAHHALAALDRMGAAPPPVVVLKTNCAPVVNEVLSTSPVEVIVVDDDTEGVEELVDVEGQPSWVGYYHPEIDATRVEGIAMQVRAGDEHFSRDTPSGQRG